MVHVMAVHDSLMTNEEYKEAVLKKYSFLSSATFRLNVSKIDEVGDLPLDGGAFHHIYFDDASIPRSDERVLQALIKFNNAKQIWVSLKNSASASTNPNKNGKLNRTFT